MKQSAQWQSWKSEGFALQAIHEAQKLMNTGCKAAT